MEEANATNDKSINQRLKIGMALNTAFAVLEIGIGIMAGSLALVSDAAHNLTDSLSLLVAWMGQKIARRPATSEHTFGYGKATILTALTNSLILIAIAGYIFFEAYQKITNPTPVKGGLIIVVAGIGILVNSAVALMFLKHRSNLNMRGVFLNMAFDALASVGAVIAGVVIYYTGKSLADPLISIVIGGLLVYGSIMIIYDAVHILLEGVPENINPSEVKRLIEQAPGVKNVHDFHLWSIASQSAALSCHVVALNYNLERNIDTIKEIKRQLKEKFGISHATIEVELTKCPPHEH